MSYDVWLEIDAGGANHIELNILHENYTWNVGPMFYKALENSSYEKEGTIYFWDKMKAADVGLRCRRILCKFNESPDDYIALNPENGWGDFEGAKNFIQKIKDACDLAPNAIFRIC